MSPEAREQMIEALVRTLPVRWQRGTAQKHLEAQDVAPMLDAFLSSPVMVDLVKAVEPFAELSVPDSWPDNRYGIQTGVTAGQIRNLRKAYSPFKSGG